MAGVPARPRASRGKGAFRSPDRLDDVRSSLREPMEPRRRSGRRTATTSRSLPAGNSRRSASWVGPCRTSAAPEATGLAAPGTAQEPCLFGDSGRLKRVSAVGGEPIPVGALDESRQETAHMLPSFLPDGNHFLYLAWSTQQPKRAIYVGSLESNETRQALRLTVQSRVCGPGLPSLPPGRRALRAALRCKEARAGRRRRSNRRRNRVRRAGRRGSLCGIRQ